jgi:drug/metabolite transporter (DMT)-like permease
MNVDPSGNVVRGADMTFLAYILGFLAALANAAANTLQRVTNRDEGQEKQFSWQLVKDLLRKPLWFAGILAIAGSFFLQATGLGFGTLAAVEPLMVLELPLTMIASRIWLGSRLDRRAWGAILAMTASTIALIAFLGPGRGRTTGISWTVYLGGILATGAVVAACYILGVRWQDPARRAAVMGVGTGVAYGLAAALTKGMTEQFSSGGIVGVFEAWQLYAAVVIGGLAVWMHQNAVGAGRLVVAQPGVTLADPYVSILWGAAVFAEPMRSGFWVVLALLAGAGLTVSAIVLSKSRETSSDQSEEEEEYSAEGQERAAS